VEWNKVGGGRCWYRGRGDIGLGSLGTAVYATVLVQALFTQDADFTGYLSNGFCGRLLFDFALQCKYCKLIS